MGLIKIHKFIFNGFSFSDFASTLLTLSQNMRLISAVVVRRNMLAPSLCLTTGLTDREMLSCYRRYTKATHKPIHLVHAIYTNRVQLEVVWILMRLNGKSTQITNTVSQCWQESVEYVSIYNYKVLCAWLIFFSQLAFIIHFYSCTTALTLTLHVSMHISNTVESYIKRFLTCSCETVKYAYITMKQLIFQ